MTGVVVTGSQGDLWDEKGHILTIMKERSGKGTCIILPAMLHNSLYNDDAPSFVILDPKGENLAVAGDHLLRCDYDIIVINPFQIPELHEWGDTDRFNPFDLIVPGSPSFNSYINLIRNAIIPPDPVRHANSFFSEGASEILALYISHLMTQDQEPKTIKTLSRWLRYIGADRQNLMRSMGANPYGDISLEAHRLAGEAGLNSFEDRFANVNAAIGCFRNEGIRHSMSDSTFDVRNVARNKTALFICVPSDDMVENAAWLRILIASLLRVFKRYYSTDRKLVMLMDEFASMGRLEEFENSMAFMGQYVTLWPIVQNLNQLKKLYPSIWEGFVGGASIRHWLVRDNFSAEYLSKRMPMDIVFLGENADGSPRYEKKPLMTAAEVMQCNDIIFEIDGLGRPALLPRVPYWKVTNNHSPNPFY